MSRIFIKSSLFLLLMVLVNACFLKSDYEFDTKLLPVKSGGKWGYINHSGQYVINPQFEEAGLFRCGLALVKNIDGKAGFINKKGSYVIMPEFIDATPFSCDVALAVREGDHIVCINKKGEEIFKLQQAKTAKWFTEDLAAFMNKDGKWGFVNKKGEVVISPQFSNVHPFKEGLAAVLDKNGKWGFIDKSGTLAINYQFEEVDDFSEGLAAFSNGDKCGYISKEGAYAINPQFDLATSFYDGKAAVVQGESCGFIDKKGHFIINPQFDFDVEPAFMEGVAAVSSGDKAGFIDEKGKYVINPQFDFAYPFIDGLAAVYNAGQFGFIDKKGKYVINPQFDLVFQDLYENFGSIAPSVRSDYYNSDEFVKTLLDLRATTTCFDSFCANSTLENISEHSLYKDASLLTREVVYRKSQAITPDIDIKTVTFYFDSDTYYYDYWYYSRNLNNSLPIKAICYEFDLGNDASDRGCAIAKALKNGFARNYDVKFDEVRNKSGVGYTSFQSEGKLSFVIVATTFNLELWIGTDSAKDLKEFFEKNSIESFILEEVDDIAEEAVADEEPVEEDIDDYELEEIAE